MRYFRNPQARNEFIICLIVSAIVTAVSFSMKMEYGILMLVTLVIVNGVHFFYTYLRYRRIQKLAEEIDKILHNDVDIVWKQFEEGELAILESEVQKMTIRIREQKQQLLDDKKYLANSIADISHQIRTPLTSINLLLDFLKEGGTEQERQIKIRQIYDLLRRIDWLITTLLKISKLDAGTIQLKKEELPMETLIQKSVSPLLVPMELRGQTLQVTAEGTFYGDLDWTSEAIGNIVKNCMEHTPKGGTVTVEATENTLYREIMISDSGEGIAPEDLPHIFERFYKGKNCKDNSFGVGLALARGIIHNQNGTLKAENKREGGAKFSIRMYKEL